MGGETGQSSPPLLCPDQWEQQSDCQLRIPRWLAGAKDRGAASWPRGRGGGQSLSGAGRLCPSPGAWLLWVALGGGRPSGGTRLGGRGAGLPRTAIPDGLNVCPVLESRAQDPASGWAAAARLPGGSSGAVRGAVTPTSVHSWGAVVAGQVCAGPLPLPRWGVWAKESSAPCYRLAAFTPSY